jgi:hypothetical protein
MKITIYTLTTDTDDGMHSQVFTNEAKRDDAVFEWLAERDDSTKARTAKQIKKEFDGDMVLAGEAINNGEDFLSFDDHEIDLPDAPVNAALLAAAKAMVDAGTEFTREWAKSALVAAIAQAEAAPSLAENERPVRVAIEVSGGLVQTVYSDCEVQVFLLDQDNEHPDWQSFEVDPETPTRMSAIAKVAEDSNLQADAAVEHQQDEKEETI